MIKTGLKWSGLLLLTSIAASTVAWYAIPAEALISVPWNFGDGFNRYANKMEALLLMPAIIAGVIALFAGLPSIEPRKKNLEKSASAWLAGWIGCTTVFAVAHFFVVYVAFTGTPVSDKFIPISASIMFMVVGNYIAKSRSNWMSSIPVPWALESEHAWTMASRFRGLGFVLTGALALVASLFVSGYTVRILLLSGAVASILVSIVVSYFAWRDDPERAETS